MGKFDGKKKEEDVQRPRKPGTWGFGIGDCPIWLFRKFDELSKAKHRNQYWVTLMELIQKAEAYDMAAMGGVVDMGPQDDGSESVEETKEEKKDTAVPTMGGNTGVIKKIKGE